MTTELILIGVIILITFGIGKMPQIATTLGRMRVGFKQGLSGQDVAGQDASPQAQEPEASHPKPGSRKPGKFDDTVEDARVDP